MSKQPLSNPTQADAVLGLAQTDTVALERAERALSLLLYSDDFYALEELLGWWSDLVPMPREVDAILTQVAEMIDSGALESLVATIRSAKRAAAGVGVFLSSATPTDGLV